MHNPHDSNRGVISSLDAFIDAAPEIEVFSEEGKSKQSYLGLIPHKIGADTITQRAVDGYINATALCSAVSKRYADYSRLRSTQEYLEELSAVTGIPITELVVIKQGGSPSSQGTWVHPDLSIHLAQWCSPKFGIAVSRLVQKWFSGELQPSAELPAHIQRYLDNRGKIPPTHFSMLNEMTFGLVAPLEQAGYTLPDGMIPDISEGRMFCGWLRRELKVEPNDFPTYIHKYPDGRQVRAKLYPNEYLAAFREHFHGTWIPLKMVTYFEERDKTALEYIRQTNLLEDSSHLIE